LDRIKGDKIADPIINFTASRTEIYEGESVLLKWSVFGANIISIYLDPFSNVAIQGEREVTPPATMTYRIRVIDLFGTYSNSIKITVIPLEPGPGPEPPTPDPDPSPVAPVVSFATSDYTINRGESVRLSWSVTGAVTSVTLTTLGNVPKDSYAYVSPEETTTYILRACNGDVCTERTKVITVKVPEEPELPKPPPEVPLQEPNFLVDPIGWTIYTIFNILASFLGRTIQGFFSLLSMMDHFINNFYVDVRNLFNNPVQQLRLWLDNVYTRLTRVYTMITSSINNWWITTSQTVLSWINSITRSLLTTINNLANSLNNLIITSIQGVRQALANAYNSLTSVIAGIQTTIGNLLNGVIDELTGYVDGLLSVFEDATFGALFQGFNAGLNEELSDRDQEEIDQEINNFIRGGGR
jgi:hypothetical protein